MKTIGSLLIGLIINTWSSASDATILAFHAYMPVPGNAESLRVTGTVFIHIDESSSKEKVVTRIVVPKPLKFPKTRADILTKFSADKNASRPKRPCAKIKEKDKLLGSKKEIKPARIDDKCEKNIESLSELIAGTTENSQVVIRTITFKDNKIIEIGTLNNESGPITDPYNSHLQAALGKNKKDSTGHLLQKLLSEDMWKNPDVLQHLLKLIHKTKVTNDFDPIFGTNCRYSIELFTSQSYGLFGLILSPDDQPEHALYLDFVPLPSVTPEELAALHYVSNGEQILTEIYQYCDSHFPPAPNQQQASASEPESEYVEMAPSPCSLSPGFQFASTSVSGASNTPGYSLFQQPYIHTMPNMVHQFHSLTTATQPSLPTVPENDFGFLPPTSLPIPIGSRGASRHASPPSAATSSAATSFSPDPFNPSSPTFSFPPEPHYMSPRSLSSSSHAPSPEEGSGGTWSPNQNQQSSQEEFVILPFSFSVGGGNHHSSQTTPVLIPGEGTNQRRAVSFRTRTKTSVSSAGGGRSQGYHSEASSSAPPHSDDYMEVMAFTNGQSQLIAPEDLPSPSDSGVQFLPSQVTERDERRRSPRRKNYENSERKFVDPSGLPVYKPAYENVNFKKKYRYDNVNLPFGQARQAEMQEQEQEEEEALQYGLSISKKLEMAGKLPYNPDDDPDAGDGTSQTGSLSPSVGHIYYQPARTTDSGGSGKTSSKEKTKEAATRSMSGYKAVINQTDFFPGIISDTRNRPALQAPAVLMRSDIK